MLYMPPPDEPLPLGVGLLRHGIIWEGAVSGARGVFGVRAVHGAHGVRGVDGVGAIAGGSASAACPNSRLWAYANKSSAGSAAAVAAGAVVPAAVCASGASARIPVRVACG